jgi:hypothetical protein
VLRILLDENVHLGAAAALRSRGLDTVHVGETGLQGSSDVMVLEASIAQDRILVTRDYSDFAVLVTNLHRTKRSFPGVLYASVSLPAESPGALADAVVRFASRPGGVPPGTVAWLTAE